jgi:hypothetical protein
VARGGRHGAREFFAVDEIERACEVIVARGDETDVFVGVAPRVRRSGAAGDVERIHTGSLASPVAFATVSGGDESQQQRAAMDPVLVCCGCGRGIGALAQS